MCELHEAAEHELSHPSSFGKCRVTLSKKIEIQIENLLLCSSWLLFRASRATSFPFTSAHYHNFELYHRSSVMNFIINIVVTMRIYLTKVIEICIDSNYLELCSCRATDSKLTTILIAMKIYFHFNHSAKSCQNEQWNLITDFRTLKRGRNGKLSMELKVWWYISVISFISRNMLLYSCCSHRLLPQPNLKGPYKTWRSSMQRHQRFVGWTGSMELW